MNGEWSFEPEIEYDAILPECYGKYDADIMAKCSTCPFQDGCFKSASIPDAGTTKSDGQNDDIKQEKGKTTG